MKKDIHPKYQKVLFVDSSTGQKFVCGTTLQPQGTEKYEGQEHPVFYLSTSSFSHPFFTGSKQYVDAEGRVDKFKKRYIAVAQKNQEMKEAKVEAAAKTEQKSQKGKRKKAKST